MGYMLATAFCLAMLVGSFVYEARRLKKEQLHYRTVIDNLLQDADAFSDMRTM